MRTVICWLFLTVASHAAQYLVYYYLPTGNNGRQTMEVEASDSGTARRIFQAMMPRARISEVKQWLEQALTVSRRIASVSLAVSVVALVASVGLLLARLLH